MSTELSPPPPPQTRAEVTAGRSMRAHHVALLAFVLLLLSCVVGGGLYYRALPRLRAEARGACYDACEFVGAIDARIFAGRCVCSNGATPLEKCGKR